ncbi:TorF family putative porin [Piscinibacter sakaiensis]|uniref:Putative signal peptide protein n=1 Tax=Piscinibacter sakaiensis TaxID=1547922 RepID=A0A0K8NZX0_PISS1|nr:TorF family putative porin [Piscinibacter sakaiensis]GAP35947.1 putative signal peptide protein [Piscinibacter sakaiensis]
MSTSRSWAVAGLLALTSIGALAQSTGPTVTGNLSLVSDYRFRGISQTDKKPALQGGFDFSHPSGFYLGNWNSNLDSAFYNGANLEMDFYGGFKTEVGGVGLDVGAIYYYYPGSGKGGTTKIDNTELYVGATFGPATLKYSHATSDFFGAPNTKNSGYLDLSLAQDLGGGFGVNAHVGYQKVRNVPGAAGKITDYKLGVTYDLSGFVLGASYVGTNRDGIFFGPQSGKDLAKDTVVLSVLKSF